MGKQYQKKEYEKSQGLVLKTESLIADNEEDDYCSLNLKPDDPLIPYAATSVIS